MGTPLEDAATKANEYYSRYFWFNRVDAQPASDSLVLTGHVLEKVHLTQAVAFAENLWKPVICNVNIAFHFLVLYHLVFDSVILLIASRIIAMLPHNSPVLVFFHEFGTVIVLGALLLHLFVVMYKNLRH